MTAYPIAKPGDVRVFMFAGKARLTLRSKRTGVRYTYRVRLPRGERRPSTPFFVSVLTGNDNESHFEYIGLYRGIDFQLGVKSRLTHDAPSVKAWRWFNREVVVGDGMPHDLEVWHEGRCGRCGRALTVPESIERGIGPECWQIMGG